MKLMAYKYTYCTHNKTCKKPEIIPVTWQKTPTASINKENIQVKLQH